MSYLNHIQIFLFLQCYYDYGGVILFCLLLLLVLVDGPEAAAAAATAAAMPPPPPLPPPRLLEGCMELMPLVALEVAALFCEPV